MQRHRIVLTAFVFASLLSSLCLKAQQPGAEQVAGKVVNAIDGRPLPHATVTLTNLKGERIAATTLTDDDGHFRFDPLAPGKYRLTGTAAHYITAAYLAHGQFGTAIVTGAGLATDALVLQLIPTATISGQVLDESGEPVQRANVALYREDLTGSERIARFRNTSTNEDGEYEFTRLPRGRYFLSASGAPWYAVHPPAEQEGSKPPYRTAVDPALDVAYPMVFYPNALDSDAASPLTINGGEELTANMQLHPEHAVTLTLRPSPGAKLNQFMPRLTRSIFGLEEPIPIQSEFIDGMQKFIGIPPGQYSARLVAPGGNGFPVYSEPVNLTNAATSINIPETADLATVEVTVHSPDGASLPKPLQLNLRGTQLNHSLASIIRVTDKGIAHLDNIPPGDYSFVLNGAKRMNVVRLAVNGKPVVDKHLHITVGGNVPVDLTVSAVSVQIDGFAKRDGKAAEASMLVLVPAGADTSEDLFRRDQSDLDGSFTFNDVPPGDYILIAIDDGWPLRWTDIPTLTPYLAHGVSVTVPATNSPIHLGQPITTQSRTASAP